MHTPPAAIRSVTLAGSTVAPRSLKTRTRCPSAMPRAAASAVWSQTSSRSGGGRTSWVVSIRSCDLSTSSYEMGLQRVATLAAQRLGLPHDQKRQREEQSLAYGPAARTAQARRRRGSGGGPNVSLGVGV